MISELLCVVTGACIIAVAVVLHVRYERAGKMEWTSARWRDLACDRNGKSAALAAVRLGLSAYAVMTICIMASTPVRTTPGGHPVLGGAPHVLRVLRLEEDEGEEGEGGVEEKDFSVSTTATSKTGL